MIMRKYNIFVTTSAREAHDTSTGRTPRRRGSVCTPTRRWQHARFTDLLPGPNELRHALLLHFFPNLGRGEKRKPRRRVGRSVHDCAFSHPYTAKEKHTFSNVYDTSIQNSLHVSAGLTAVGKKLAQYVQQKQCDL